MDSLFYLLDRTFQMTLIPVRAYDGSGKVAIFNRGYKPEYDPFTMGDLKPVIISEAEKITLPFLKTEEDTCAYGIMKDPTNCVIVLGPILIRHMSDYERHKYARSHRVPSEELKIALGSLHVLSSTLALLYFARTGEKLTESGIDIKSENEPTRLTVNEKDVNKYIMQNVEDDIGHITYKTEFLYLKQIREGDVEGITNYIDPNFNLNDVGQLAKKPLKHFEYMICSSITLATRAAIEGGVAPQTAYAISDLYMQRLETCESVDDFFAIQVEMKLAYAMQVKSARDTRSKTSYVEKSKIFIANHLNKPFELEELAKELSLNKAYLSRKFKEEIGMGIMHYTRLQRVEAAANMLKYSDESISTIANYLCFPSQSHFGAVFKELKGVTPQKYRDTEKVT